jgi:hypothetical protein
VTTDAGSHLGPETIPEDQRLQSPSTVPVKRDISTRPTGEVRTIVSDSTLNIVMAVAGLVASTAIAIFLYYRAKKEPRPVYVVTGNTVVRAHAEREIEVRYRDRDVPVVTRTVIAFWNAGRQSIRRADIVENHPLTVVLPDGADVLEARIVAVTRPDIDFLVSWGPPTLMSDGAVEIKTHLVFSFLNHRDGGAIEILHTGDDPFAATVEGAIVGVKGQPRRLGGSLWDDPAGIYGPLFMAALGFTAGTVLLLNSAWWGLASIFWIGAISLCLLAANAWRNDRRRLPSQLRRSLGSGVT